MGAEKWLESNKAAASCVYTKEHLLLYTPSSITSYTITSMITAFWLSFFKSSTLEFIAFCLTYALDYW